MATLWARSFQSLWEGQRNKLHNRNVFLHFERKHGCAYFCLHCWKFFLIVFLPLVWLLPALPLSFCTKDLLKIPLQFCIFTAEIPVIDSYCLDNRVPAISQICVGPPMFQVPFLDHWTYWNLWVEGHVAFPCHSDHTILEPTVASAWNRHLAGLLFLLVANPLFKLSKTYFFQASTPPPGPEPGPFEIIYLVRDWPTMS